MDCQSDPELKEVWGCEVPTQVACWEDEEYEFFSCPFLYIPSTIVEWFSEYNYYKEFAGTAPDYWEQTEKWVTCASIYSGEYSKYMMVKQKQETAKIRSQGAGHASS